MTTTIPAGGLLLRPSVPSRRTASNVHFAASSPPPDPLIAAASARQKKRIGLLAAAGLGLSLIPAAIFGPKAFHHRPQGETPQKPVVVIQPETPNHPVSPPVEKPPVIPATPTVPPSASPVPQVPNASQPRQSTPSNGPGFEDPVNTANRILGEVLGKNH